MSSKPPSSPGESQNPADIAREAFRRLATRRIAPTPEAYRDIYNEIAGIVNTPAPATQIGTANAAERGPENVLSDFATRLSDTPGDLTEFGRRFNRAVQARDWDGYARALSQLVDKHFIKKGGIETAAAPDSEQSRQLRDLLSRTLTFAVASLLSGTPALVAEAESLGVATRLAHSEEALAEIAVRLKQLCYQIELKSGDTGEQQELLLRLFKLLLENVSELLDDDSWLRGQIEAVQNLIAGPIDVRALEEATRSLKEVIYKQGQLKHSISDVKLTVKNMMMTFIDRLGQVAASTGDFHEKIGGYSEKISKADNISELNEILDEVLRETRVVQRGAEGARQDGAGAPGSAGRGKPHPHAGGETAAYERAGARRPADGQPQPPRPGRRVRARDRPFRPPRHAAVHRHAGPRRFQETQRHLRPHRRRRGAQAPGQDRQGHVALDGRHRPLRRRGIPDPAAGNDGRGGHADDDTLAARADQALLPARQRESLDHLLGRRGAAQAQ